MKYPFDSPQVVFAGNLIPVHPHIYSNGHICLSILTEDWSPALSVQSVCLSIISMLSSAKEKVRPVDDSFYVKTCSKNPKKTPWHYHDDSIWVFIYSWIVCIYYFDRLCQLITVRWNFGISCIKSSAFICKIIQTFSFFCVSYSFRSRKT